MRERGTPGDGPEAVRNDSADVHRGVYHPRTVDVRRVLDDAQWTPFQKRVLALVSLIIILDGLDTQTLTLAIPTLMHQWGLTRAPFGLVVALGFVAMAIGTALGGLAGDRLGRRVALLSSIALFSAGTLAGALAPDLPMLGLTRMIAGLGLGAAMPNATAMAAEYTPLRQRSLALGIAMGSVPIGGFLGAILASSILSRGSWRELFWVCGLIPLGGAALLAFALPESVRFLLGRPGSSGRIAALLRKLGHPADSRDRFIDTGESHAEKPALTQIFTPAHRRDTMVLAGAFFLIIFANLFVVSWSPSLLADLAYPPRITSMGSAMWSMGGLIGAIAGAALFGRFGSRIALRGMTCGAVAIAAIMCLVPLGPHGIGARGVLGLLLIGGVMVAGSQVMLFALAGQIYPTTIRATGVGFAAAVGRIGAVVSGLTGPLMLARGPLGFFGTVAVAMLASGIMLQLMRGEVFSRRAGAAAPTG